MNSIHTSFRTAGPEQLACALREARNYTLCLFDAFVEAGLDDSARVPQLKVVNPPLWELGHIAWFAELFIVRQARSSDPGDACAHSLLGGGDALFDSSSVAHSSRWALPLPATRTIKAYCAAVLEHVLGRLAREAHEDAALYFYRLSLAHEDMHGEALLYTLQTLGLRAPPMAAQAPGSRSVHSAGSGQIAFAAAVTRPFTSAFAAPAPGAGGFAFDNELGAPAFVAAPFQIDKSMISNAEFAAFIAAGGYQERAFWSEAGLAWLASFPGDSPRAAPRYWQREGDGWRTQHFGVPCVLAEFEPVRHVTLHEAQAYCAWAGRGLPSEAQWQLAASSGDARFEWGQLWEWTATPFEPYPGFVAGPYREYSAPWFATHQVLRGASFATPARLRAAQFRNFYAPQRDDMFGGFRTCAL